MGAGADSPVAARPGPGLVAGAIRITLGAQSVASGLRKAVARQGLAKTRVAGDARGIRHGTEQVGRGGGGGRDAADAGVRSPGDMAGAFRRGDSRACDTPARPRGRRGDCDHDHRRPARLRLPAISLSPADAHDQTGGPRRVQAIGRRSGHQVAVAKNAPGKSKAKNDRCRARGDRRDHQPDALCDRARLRDGHDDGAESRCQRCRLPRSAHSRDRRAARGTGRRKPAARARFTGRSRSTTRSRPSTTKQSRKWSDSSCAHGKLVARSDPRGARLPS